MNHKVARNLRWLLTAVILAFLVVFARTIDWGAAWSSMRHASLPLLVAAIAVNFVSIALKGIRWWLFLRAAGVPSFPLALRATLAGAGLNNVLVANGGDAARVVFVSRATGVSTPCKPALGDREWSCCECLSRLPIGRQCGRECL